MNQKDQLHQPFFARLLEAQRATQESQSVYPPVTLPLFDDVQHSLKYPSDGDEGV
jgi:hypothetical protein